MLYLDEAMMHKRPLFTDYLYAVPSLLFGIARLFDFWGSFTSYNTSLSNREADSKAIYSDWRAVGQDLRTATRQHIAEP